MPSLNSSDNTDYEVVHELILLQEKSASSAREICSCFRHLLNVRFQQGIKLHQGHPFPCFRLFYYSSLWTAV